MNEAPVDGPTTRCIRTEEIGSNGLLNCTYKNIQGQKIGIEEKLRWIQEELRGGVGNG